jgi:hypothetical protein
MIDREYILNYAEDSFPDDEPIYPQIDYDSITILIHAIDYYLIEWFADEFDTHMPEFVKKSGITQINLVPYHDDINIRRVKCY